MNLANAWEDSKVQWALKSYKIRIKYKKEYKELVSFPFVSKLM
jgi:hypothetical protein